MHGFETTPNTIETTASHQVTDTSGGSALSSIEISAEYIGSGSVLVGKTVGKLEVPMYIQGSPTGDVIGGVFDSSGNTLHTFGTVTVLQ